MYKKLPLLSAAMLIGLGAYAQVNVGSNAAPNADAMLQVTSSTKGFLLPSVALTATNSASPLGAFVAGMTVFNTATAGTAPNNVTPGYYYSDGSQWIKLVGSASGNDKNLYEGDGALTGSRTVNMGDNNLTFSGNAGNLIYNPATTGKVGVGTVAPASKVSVSGNLAVGSTYAAGNAAPANGAIVQGQVGIGTPSVNASADLTLGSTNKGFLPNNVSLVSTTDGTTIPSPAPGLVVYNTNAAITNGYGTGLYINTGTAAAPVWGQLAVTSPTQGSTVSKIIYSGNTGNTGKTVTIGNFVFRFSANSPGTAKPQVALTAPQNLVVYIGTNQQYAGNGYEYANTTLTYNTGNYNTFQDIMGTMANYELNVMNIIDVTNNNYYRVTFYISGGGTPDYVWAIMAEKF